MAELTNFERVKIQMEYVVPLIKDLQALLGESIRWGLGCLDKS